MMAFQLTFVLIQVYLHSILVIACDISDTNIPQHGFQCVSTATSDVRQAAHPQCVWQCLRMKTCRYINHNSATGQCELGLGQCESWQLESLSIPSDHLGMFASVSVSDGNLEQCKGRMDTRRE